MQKSWVQSPPRSFPGALLQMVACMAIWIAMDSWENQIQLPRPWGVTPILMLCAYGFMIRNYCLQTNGTSSSNPWASAAWARARGPRFKPHNQPDKGHHYTCTWQKGRHTKIMYYCREWETCDDHWVDDGWLMVEWTQCQWDVSWSRGNRLPVIHFRNGQLHFPEMGWITSFEIRALPHDGSTAAAETQLWESGLQTSEDLDWL